MTDGERLTASTCAVRNPVREGQLPAASWTALAAGLGIQTQEGRLMGDVLDDIAAKTGVERDDRL